MIIKEGSKVDIYINYDLAQEVIADEEIEIIPNQLITQMVHRGLIVTMESDPIEKIGYKHYKINARLQDAIGVLDGYMYKSIIEME